MKKARKKGGNKEKVFGCDLLEHLSACSQEIPVVLQHCSRFIEHHGIVDGIYRLSGVSSNTQKLRAEFDEGAADLNKDVYLQDIHCVSSLCKAYFRELPNPLLTYQLYDKFAEAVAIHLEDERLVKIKDVLNELPLLHYRTLEYLMRHLVRMASYSSQTNMHARNLAIVWAPNLLRSKDIEVSGFNGTAAFMEVRVQSVVVEFILTHVKQLFPEEGESMERRQSLPFQAPSNYDDKMPPVLNPGTISPGDGPLPMRPYHAIIEGMEKRKGSLKGRKWTSIFNLGGRLNERKSKCPRKEKEKSRLRPAKSMDSLSSVPYPQEGSMQRPSVCHLSPVSPQHPCTPTGGESGVPVSSPGGLGSGYAVTYRRGGGASVSMVSGAGTPGTYSRLDSGGAATTVAVDGQHPLTRSPAASSRAERRAGIHISGPFSVTVPLHITSGLALGVLQGSAGEKGEGAGPQRGDDKEGGGRQRRGVESQKEELREPVQEGGRGEEGVADSEEGARREPAIRQEDNEGAAGTEQEEEQETGQKENGIEAAAVQHKPKAASGKEEEVKNGPSNEEESTVEPEAEEHNEEVQKDKEEDKYVAGMSHSVSPYDDFQDLPLDFQDTFGFLDLMDTSTSNQMNEFSVEPPCYDMDEEDECRSEGQRSSRSSCHALDLTSPSWQHQTVPEAPVHLRPSSGSSDFDLRSRACKTQSLPYKAGLFLPVHLYSDEEDDDDDQSEEDEEEEDEEDKLFYSLPHNTRLRTQSESGAGADHNRAEVVQGQTSCPGLGQQADSCGIDVSAADVPEADQEDSTPDLCLPDPTETAEEAAPHDGTDEGKSLAQTSEREQGDPKTETHTADMEFQAITADAYKQSDEDEGQSLLVNGEEEKENGLPSRSSDDEEGGELAVEDTVCNLDADTWQGESRVTDTEVTEHAEQDVSEGSSHEQMNSAVVSGDTANDTEWAAEDTTVGAKSETSPGSVDTAETSFDHLLPLSDTDEILPEDSTVEESWSEATTVSYPTAEDHPPSPSNVTEEHTETCTEGEGCGVRGRATDQDADEEGNDQVKEHRQEPLDVEERQTELPGCEDEDGSGTMKTGGESESPSTQEMGEEYMINEGHKDTTEEESDDDDAIEVDGGEMMSEHKEEHQTTGVTENESTQELSVEQEPKVGEDGRSERGPHLGPGLGRTLVVSKVVQPRVHQAKAVPVVPPKPQLSKLAALNLRQQLQQRDTEWHRERDGQGQGQCEGGDREAKRNSAISMCFDEAVARATERRERGKEREKERGADEELK